MLSPAGLLMPALLLPAALPAEEMPSMAFLEYLGGVEAEIDGRLSSPVELDLESAVAARSENNIDEENDGEQRAKNSAEDTIDE